MEKEKLIEIKENLRKKKPKFHRQEAHVRKRLGTSWRRPRGYQSKMRLRKAGKNARVDAGFGSPRSLRHTYEGKIIVRVSSLAQLIKINKETEVVMFASALGLKKRAELVKKAQELNIQIINLKDTTKVAKKIEEKQKAAKEKKAKKAEKEKVAKKPTKKEKKPKVEEQKSAPKEEKKKEPVVEKKATEKKE